MKALMKAFKKAVALDSTVHRKLRVRMPEDYSFMKDTEIVPLTFSEILSATMYYPVMFGVQDNIVFPFAVIGINGRNIFLKDDGTWKVEVVPNMCKHYPFGVFKEGQDYTIVFDEIFASEQGEVLFDKEGNDTEFFSTIKSNLTEFARDLHDAEEFSGELIEGGYLKQFNLDVDTNIGKMELRKMLMVNLEQIVKIQPEKLYSLNCKGYLLILHAHYLSLRNFKLFDVFAEQR